MQRKRNSFSEEQKYCSRLGLSMSLSLTLLLVLSVIDELSAKAIPAVARSIEKLANCGQAWLSKINTPPGAVDLRHDMIIYSRFKYAVTPACGNYSLSSPRIYFCIGEFLLNLSLRNNAINISSTLTFTLPEIPHLTILRPTVRPSHSTNIQNGH